MSSWATAYQRNGERSEGLAFVYQGSSSGLSTTPDWTAESNQDDAHFGDSGGTAGDVNADGYDDVVVGATEGEQGETDEGQAFLYHGSADGLSTTPSWTAESNQANAHFGSAVGTAGDVNGDGYDDVIVGARYYSNGQPDEGRAYVFLGGASGLSLTPEWITESNQANTYFGISVGTAGDVNGDGFHEVSVGATRYDNGQRDEGRAFLYRGSPSGLPTEPTWTAEPNSESAWFGSSVGAAGDVNADSFEDVIVGSFHYTHGKESEGAAFGFLGPVGR
jgi:FG-GAP-like repeat/FG-GAP repeat